MVTSRPHQPRQVHMGRRFYRIQVGFVFNFLFSIGYFQVAFFISSPERWTNIPHAAASVPGVWANILTFFEGPRSCIGYRFALVE